MSHFEKVWERVLLVLTHHTTWFSSLGWNSLLLFFEEFASIIPFMAWFEMLMNSREAVTFSSLSLPVIAKQTYLFLKNLNAQSFSLCWSRWDNFESDLKSLQIRLKCVVIGAFSFSSKNTSMTLELLFTGWHKNW